MKNYLSVSELSSLFGISIQTLHYYDKIGLFEPAYRNKRTGYREYRFDQIYQLTYIRYLRKMNYSIAEIRRYLVSRNANTTIELLKERSQMLQKEWRLLIRIDEAILRKIQFIEHKRANLDLKRIEVRWFPERHYLPIGTEDKLYLDDSFYFYPTIAFYSESLKFFGAYTDLSVDGIRMEGESEEELKINAIPAGKYLTGYHQGPYEKIQETFFRMRKAHAELSFTDYIVTFNIIDQFVERDSKNYITEVQILLK